jgi:TP901 family phage tail tape measure protein
VGTVSVVYDLIGRDSASKAFNSAGKSASGLEKTLKGLGAAAVAVGAAVAAGAVVVAEKSIKAAVDFQASMEKIHTQAGATQGAVNSLTKSVLAMAPSTQQGPQALADALYHLKSVGLDNANAMKALRVASDLAAVGGSDLEQTTNALAGAWRSGIKGATDFNTAAAVVNATIGAGNMTMQDYVDAIGTGILPIARTFGISLQSIGAALALMTDEGVPAVDAATRLKTSITLLGAPSVTASKYLAQIGVTGLQLANAMRSPQGLIGAIGLLKQHLDASGMSASQQAQVISRAFGGGHTGAAIMTLLNNFDVLEKKQQQINTTIGKYGGAVTAQRQTAQAQFALLRSSLDTLGVRLGLDLLPPVTSFTKFLAQKAVPAAETFASKVMNLLPVKPVEDAASKIVGTIERLLGIGGGGSRKAAPKPVVIPVKAVGMSASTVRDMFTRSAAGMAPLELPVTATGMSRSTYEAVSTSGPALAKAVTQSLGGTLASLGGTLINKLLAATKKIDWGKILADVINGAVSSAQAIGAAFLQLLGKIDWVSLGDQFATAVIGLAIGLVNNLVPALISTAIHHPLDMLSFLLALIPIGKAAGILVKIFADVPIVGTLAKWLLTPLVKVGDLLESALGGMLKKVFGPVGDRIGGFFSGAKTWLVSKGEDVLLGLWYGSEDAWATVVRWLGKIKGWVVEPFARAEIWLFQKGMDVLGGLLSGAERGWSIASEWLGGIGSRIGGLFAKSGSWLYDHGRNIIGGLYNGIKDAIAGVGSWVKTEIVDPIVNWVKSWFGIHSPSTVMAWVGSHLMGGLFKGMMSHDLGGMVKLIFGSLPDALGAIVEKGLASLGSLPGKALEALGSLFGFGGGGKYTGSGAGSAIASTLNEQLGQMMAAAMGWTGQQWSALYNLWTRESGWNTFAKNPASGAYGIPQSLPAAKMASAGPDWATNPATQIKWGLDYIASVYGSPLAAWGHEKLFNWYGYGGQFAANQLIGVGDRGPELVAFGQSGRVFSPEQSAALIAAANRGSDGGTFTGTLILDSGELLGVVRGEIRRDEKETLRAARSGSGTRR